MGGGQAWDLEGKAPMEIREGTSDQAVRAGRTVRESQVVMSQVMLPGDANQMGNVHGSVIMKLVDTAAGVAATRHVRGRVVTARIDSMSFLQPVYVGDLVTVKASVNDVGRTSMEVGVRVEAEDLTTGVVRHVSSAHLVFVALDDAGRPTPVPPLLVETDEERRRMEEAKIRRANRQRGDETMQAMRRGQRSRHILQAWRRSPTEPLVVGHRGAAGWAPENTILSFERAIALGADAVELDVHLSREGVPVVIHDHHVDRTTDGHGAVDELSLAELRALDAGARWPERPAERVPIPTLAEVLDWARGRTRLVIELKGTHRPELVDRTIELVREREMVEAVMLISFDHLALRRARTLADDLCLGALYVGRPADPVGMAAACGADALCPQWTLVSADDVASAHRAGLAVCVWTVNEPSDIAEMLARGVDSITSDFPDRVRMSARPGR